MANVEAGLTGAPPNSAAAQAAQNDAPRSPRVGGQQIEPLAVGTIIWIASELMFFVALFAAYFTLRESGDDIWPPPGVDLDVVRPLIFTIVLVVSSLTAYMGVEAARKGRRHDALAWIAGTVILGALFLANQAIEYAQLDFQIDSDAYGSIFYIITGFHALHILAGILVWLFLFWMTAAAGSLTPYGDHLRAGSYYWHFVNIVAIAVLIVVYVIQ